MAVEHQLTRPAVVKEILQSRGLRLSRARGQHFLVDARVLERIVAAAEVDGATRVVEVGAGIGTLTVALAARAREVVAVEVDDRLVPILTGHVQDLPVRVVLADALAVSWEELVGDPAQWRVVANLPYRVASTLIVRQLAAGFSRLVVMVQREVADRLLAPPGHSARGALSVLVEALATGRRVLQVPPACFYPRPKVASTVVRLDRRQDLPVDMPLSLLVRVVRGAFRHRRKQLRQALSLGLAVPSAVAEKILDAAGVSRARRPETLTLSEFAAIGRAWVEICREDGGGGTLDDLLQPDPRGAQL